MSGIVLTTDFSDSSKRAFAPAVLLADSLGLPIQLVAVLEDLPFEPTAGGLMATYPERGKIREDWEEKLKDVAKELGAKGEVKTHVLDAMDVPRAICEFAAKFGADYVAMASHGRSGLRRLLLGSVAEEVLRHSHVPVIVFPPPLENA